MLKYSVNKLELDRPIYRIMEEKYVFSMFIRKENVLRMVNKWKDKFENFQRDILCRLGNGMSMSEFMGQCWTTHCRSEAMWGIYANDKDKNYLRIRSTPRLIIKSFKEAHPNLDVEDYAIGTVSYLRESEIRRIYNKKENRPNNLRAMFIKRRAFMHESEVRLISVGDTSRCDACGFYAYRADPGKIVTQIMADPNRDGKKWKTMKEEIRRNTGFSGEILRSKMYDPPGEDFFE